MNRQAMLDALSDPKAQWDVIVIGGGATGLGTALDAASRGYRTALLEAADFAKGTSSRSTKLIHGGVRYLRQGQIRMVRDSLLERGRLRRNAPHIVHSRPFVIPTYQFARRYYYYAGMKTYDLLAGRLAFDASRLLSSRQALEALPTLQPLGLRGGVCFSDGQFDDARLAIVLAQTLVERGGVAINYMPVVELVTSDGRTNGAIARDIETGSEFQLRARVVINATGVFAESIMKLDASSNFQSKSDVAPRIVASQGTHLVLPRQFLPGHHAMLIPHTDDSRVLFAIPWLDRVLFGTTDNRVEQISLEPKPLESEINYLLEHAARYLTKQPTRSDILSAFSGLRPLIGARRDTDPTSKLSREHEIHTSPSGLITILGGKWTTYRKMGQDVIDLAARIGALPDRPSRTANLKLHGAPCQSADASNALALDASDATVATDHPLTAYGTDRSALLELADRDVRFSSLLTDRLPYSVAQVVWAVKHEMARTLEDVLARRTRALFLDARATVAAAEATAGIMQIQLGQNDEWKQRQVREFYAVATGYLV